MFVKLETCSNGSVISINLLIQLIQLLKYLINSFPGITEVVRGQSCKKIMIAKEKRRYSNIKIVH